MDHLPRPLTGDPDASLRPADIVISGTTLWNPGDDFVRGGVIAVLRRLLAPRAMNLFFYNFSADVIPPHGSQGGRGNTVSLGDLEALGDAVDMVVIAGLSAGREIKDLYRWVIDAGLTDRVLLIGAGYENPYVERHCAEDPEATIFRSARIITGRTAKRPGFIADLGTPYAHLPCPSPLSVESVKPAVVGRRAQRIGFSIQVPHEEGVVNQSTGADASALAIETMERLASRGYEITLIAHHKSEYTAFRRGFADAGVRVVFQSFATDLAEVYRDLDAMVTTRLHAGLYANAHGLPALIVNDTDRHTHALDGFRHAAWANTPEGVDAALQRMLSADLSVVAGELAADKDALMDRYVSTLRSPVAALMPASDRRDRVGRSLASAAGAVGVKHRVLSVISQLTADHWLEGNIAHFRNACAQRERWFDTLTVLNWWARAMQPRTYLEIGVRRGRSMAQVMSESPGTLAFGFDLWLPAYGSVPSEGIRVDNPGPEFVAAELSRIGAGAPAALTVGDSGVTVPAFFREEGSPETIDLMLVDGDHSDGGAREDLRTAFERVSPGGAIVFDDLTHPSHPGLRSVWDEFRAAYPSWLFIEDPTRSGTGVAVRPPFDRLEAALARESSSAHEEALAAMPPSAEAAAAKLLRRLGRPGVTALDVGAHVGTFTELLARLAGPEGRVIAVEPTPTSRDRLRARLRNRGLSNVAIEPVAASEAAGEAELREYGPALSSWNTLGEPVMERTPGDASSAITPVSCTMVRTETIDALCARHGLSRVDIVKLDVEGAEPAAVRGMRELLKSGCVGAVLFEVSSRTLEGMGAQAREIFDVLREAGYRCHAITDAGGVGDEVRDSRARHAQYVAFAPERAVGRPSLKPTAADRRTPLHVFTIVLNGMPMLPAVYESLCALQGPWRWHVIEGASELVGDTAWSVQRGGRLSERWHAAGRSVDGTTAFLDRLGEEDGDRVKVYRKPPGALWKGKREMVSAPLASIDEPCVLMQMDADELWTAEQLEGVRRLFAERPLARSAYFRCHYFVGPDRVITTRDTYGNYSSYEWLRAWRYTPGCRWLAHEPPRLVTPNPSGRGETDLATIHPIMHDETEAAGLVFQHFAYVTEAQLRFKEDYYGYAGAVEQWRSLQSAALPTRLGDHFGWVTDGAMVDSCDAAGVTPMIDVNALATAAAQTRSGTGKAAACVGS